MSGQRVLLFVAIASLASVASAQEATPRIGFLFPAGGQRGTEFDVTVGGARLNGVMNARVSGSGVTATVVEHIKPLSDFAAAQLREKVRMLREKKAATLGPGAATRPKWTITDEAALAAILLRLSASQKKPTTPAIADTVVLHVIIAPDAAPGERELRLGTGSGLTNPLVFSIGQLHEFTLAEARERNDTTVTLPAVLNGQIMPGGENRYRFKARKGNKIVAAARARELVPYLPDAVPGWFQAVLTLYDSRGVELAYADDFRFHPDPVVFCKIPADGEYTLLIRDSLYRGREDFVYRVTVGELPFIHGIFPLGGQTGKETDIQLRGWNLPRATLGRTFKTPEIYPLFVQHEDFVSNQVPFRADSLPDMLEQEPNNTPSEAKSLKPPIIVNGRIDYPGDVDVFRIDGKAGDEIVAEVYARRLYSPLDSLLKLTDASGKVLAINDDTEDKGSGLLTHHADSLVTCKLPATGAYYLHLSDAQRKGGPEFAYRLRVSAPRPDFELRIVPSSISARPGSVIPITAYALRRDGFNGDIALDLAKPSPAGFALSGAWIPSGQDRVQLTMTITAPARREPLDLSVEGRAKIDGAEVVKSAVPAEDMMQAFAYRHLVPAREMKVVIAGGGGRAGALKPYVGAPVKLVVGGETKVDVPLPSRAAGDIECKLSEPPEGMTIESTTPAGDGAETVIKCDPAKIKPGLKGNLLITVAAVAPAAEGAPEKPDNRRRTPLGLLPAIPFEVVSP